MPSLTISLVIITHNRATELESCLHSLQQQLRLPDEILVVDNGSHDNTGDLLATRFPDVRVITAPYNLGVAKGRNLGYQEATGDICVTIDDDAQLIEPDALQRVARYFETHDTLCCISFEVRDAGNNVVRKLIPRRDRVRITEDSPGASFVGTGHAMHRRRFLELGGFWEALGLYFGEEPDLSYRILEAGYQILHTPHIGVRHFESAAARPAGRRIYFGTRNTPWIAVKNLPWTSVACLTILAWAYFLASAIVMGRIGDYMRGVRDCLYGMPMVWRQRRCVSRRTRALVKQYSGVYMT